MANKPKSVWLTARTMSALRPGDALSGRINQIVDRYLQMVDDDAQEIRAPFRSRSWALMLAEVARLRNDGQILDVHGVREALAASQGDEYLQTMETGEFVVLLELLERDLASNPLPVNSDLVER